MRFPLLKNLYAADIESTGLLDDMKKQLAPHLWNLGLIDAETEAKKCFEYTQRDDIQKFLDSSPTLVMHNGLLFDYEALTFLGYNMSKVRIIDTLLISWYLEPRRMQHGLEGYGEELGVPKPPIKDWESLTQEEYNFRVMSDCEIQIRLWKKQYKQLLAIYETHQNVMLFLDYLMKKGRHLQIQQRTRWKLNVPACEALLEEINGKIEEKVSVLKETMPKIPQMKLLQRPAKPFKKDGSYSAAGLKWFNICRANNLDFNDPTIAVNYITGYKEGNPNSSIQLKDWLFSLGWVPASFKFDRNKETNETRQIPQITIKDDDGNPDICKSVHEVAEAHPGSGIEHLIGLGVLKHRASMLKGFLNNHVDGYLTARAGGFTNTLRLKHRELVNLPSLRVLYGAEIRGLLTCEDGYELLGSDLCSLEDRVKHHYQWPLDPEYVKKQMAPDFDPHLEICLMGGMLTPEQVAAHKDGTCKQSIIRGYGKATNYSCQYGAMPPTVARAAKVALAVGEALWKAYWELNWSIKEIAAHTTVKTVDGQMWQQNPINKFWYSLRADKDRFSTLCQGTGSYIFDIWLDNVINIVNERYGRDPKVAGQFHDEMILPIKAGTGELWSGILQEAMARLNAELKMNREIACDTQTGTKYADIH